MRLSVREAHCSARAARKLAQRRGVTATIASPRTHAGERTRRRRVFAAVATQGRDDGDPIDRG
jgi:hypothetical protein